MNKNTSVIAVMLFVAAAVIFGLLLVNKGDGPVMEMIISDKTIMNLQDTEAANPSKNSGIYLILEKEYNKFKEKFLGADIPVGKELYANIYIVECPKGSKFTAKWIMEGKVIKEEIKELATDQKGVVSYVLDGSKAKSGDYLIELHNEDRKIFEYKFSIR